MIKRVLSRILVISVLFFLASCGKKESIVASDEIITYKSIDGISYLECYKKNASKAPAVVVLHDFGSSKEDVYQTFRTLVDQGYFVIIPDAIGHGDRLFDNTQMLTMTEVAFNSVGEIKTLHSRYVNDSRVDISRFGLVGIGMGGITTMWAISEIGDDVIKAAAPLLMSPDMTSYIDNPLAGTVWQGSSIDNSFVKVDADRLRKVQAQLIKNNPSDNVFKLKDTWIMLQNGEMDDKVDVESSKVFIRKMQVVMDITCRAEILVYEKGKHEVLPEMVSVVSDWLKKRL